MHVEELAFTLACFRAGEQRVERISKSGIVFPAIVVN